MSTNASLFACLDHRAGKPSSELKPLGGSGGDRPQCPDPQRVADQRPASNTDAPLQHDAPLAQPKAKGKRVPSGGGPSSDTEPLLLSERDAAIVLAISPRKLWELRNRGEIPHIRIDRSVRYDPADLRKWIDARKSAS